MGRFNRLDLKFRQRALPPALCVSVFLVLSFCMRFPHWTNETSCLWLATGVSLAALLRTPRREWPLLVVASAIGTVAAALYAKHDSWIFALSRAANYALEYCLCAWIVRRRCGSYFDLANFRHLAWLAGSSTLASLLKLASGVMLPHSLEPSTPLNLAGVGSWALTAIFGVFILALPILAITSRSAVRASRLGAGAMILFLILAGELTLSFGPPAFPLLFTVMPVMMLLGWRYGLLGAGLGTLVTTIISLGLSAAHFSLLSQLGDMGYDAVLRGCFLELFLIVTILSGFSLAIVRARESATDSSLADALDAAELRAAEFAASEAAARMAEAKALQAEAEARESETAAVQAREELGRVIETSIDIICTLDVDGRFIRVSENCVRIWGWRPAELLGRLWFDFIHEDDRDLAIGNYRLRIEGKFSLPARKRHVRPDGTIVSMFWTMTWIAEDQACYCVGRDMTEWDELQERVAQSQRMDAIGQLTGGIAHDFNNLLTIILGNCEVIALKLKEPQLHKLAALSVRAAQKGAELVEQLLAFARRQALKPRRFDVRELLNSAAPLITRTLDRNVVFSISCCENLWPAFADPLQTETAILNLCINARDAMPQGGKLLIEATNVSLTQADIQWQPDAQVGDYVCICVKDSGTGMPHEVVEQIFQPFFTTKEVGKGSGLGLSMVYGFIRQSHGHVTVTSHLGEGTMIGLFLPAAPVEVEQESPGFGNDTAHPDAGTVLIVEDHDLVREHTQGQFESLGYSVIAAENGTDAIAILDCRSDIDLMFTDIVMPGGLSGFELGEIVKQRWPSIPIIYTSGYLQKKSDSIDARLLLMKPFSLNALSQKITQILGNG